MDQTIWSIIWNQTDAVGKTLLICLVIMSCVTWFIIFSKALATLRLQKQTRRFLLLVWNTPTLDQVKADILVHGASEPYSHLTIHAFTAQSHHHRHNSRNPEQAGTSGEFITRSMRKVMDQEHAKLETGLTVLATIGTVAPFVGLFGTVWGIYHALMTIASRDDSNFANLAGPVGEALIMTALGLAVAIPAVLAYNALLRVNRVYLGKLDTFAHELFTFLTTGQAITKLVSQGNNADTRGSQ
jgi:biopolymer transport protein ExbB